MLTAGEWCNPVSNMLQPVYKWTTWPGFTLSSLSSFLWPSHSGPASTWAASSVAFRVETARSFRAGQPTTSDRVGIGHERFGNVSSVLGRHPGRCYILHRKKAKSPACRCAAISTPLYNTQRSSAHSTPNHRGNSLETMPFSSS